MILFWAIFPRPSALAEAVELSLKECIDIGLSKNPDVLKAKEDIKKSEKYLLEKFSNFLPDVYLDYRFLESSSDEARKIAADEFLYAKSVFGLHIEKEIFRSGGNFYEYKTARLGLDKSKEAYLASRDKLIFEVKSAYYDLALTEGLLVINKESQERMEAYAAKVARKGQVGDVHKYEVVRSRIVVQNIESDIINLKKEETLLQTKLKRLLMIKEENNLRVARIIESPKKESMKDYTFNALVPEIHEKNRNIRVAKLSTKVGKETVNVKAARYSPSAAIKSDFYKSSDKFDFDSHYFYDWSLMIKVKVPLFDGFKTPAIVSQSMSEYRNLELTEQAVKRDTFWELEEAVSNFDKTKELLENQERLAEDARDALNMVWVLYDRGEAVQWNVIDAHINYLWAETNLLKFTRDYNVLIAKIDYLISATSQPELI